MTSKSALAACLLAGVSLGSADLTPRPTTEQIVGRMMEQEQARSSKLREYTSVRNYWLENKRMGTRAHMTVNATYRFPFEKHFEVVEESGPGVLRKKVFHRMLDSEVEASREGVRQAVQISPRNYTFRFIESAQADGRQCFILEAQPSTKNPMLFRGRIWVDAEDYAVTRIEAQPAQNPSFWIRKTSFVHRYGKFGPFWLAISNISDTDVRIFGRTEVRIEYSDYQINPIKN